MCHSTAGQREAWVKAVAEGRGDERVIPFCDVVMCNKGYTGYLVVVLVLGAEF